MLAAGAAGDVRVAWMDNRTSWYNTWYRETSDGGQTWSAEVKLSNLTEGDPWQGPLGFKIRTEISSQKFSCLTAKHFPYGDYGKLAIDSEGFSVVAWGEGPGWLSGGNVYFARQLSHS